MQRLSGDLVAAREHQHEALELSEQLNDPLATAHVLLELAVAHRFAGDYALAERDLRRALSMFGDDYEDDDAAVIALHELGIVLGKRGDHASALDYNVKALADIQRFGDHVREAGVRLALGVAHRELGDYDAAELQFTAALELYREARVDFNVAETLDDLGHLKSRTGDLAAAREHHASALAIYRKLGHQQGQAESLNALGALARPEEPELAMAHHQEALRMARLTSSQPEEARACEGIGYCLVEAGETTEGMAHLHRALEIYRRMDVPDADRLASWLASPPRTE
jgi:tetratricopeptide (TPR) repeat protein